MTKKRPIRCSDRHGAGTWTNDPDGDCADGDTDPWRGVPATTAGPNGVIARAPRTVDTAMAHLRRGFRTATSQPPGRYEAAVTFSVVAPQV